MEGFHTKIEGCYLYINDNLRNIVSFKLVILYDQVVYPVRPELPTELEYYL